MSAIAASPVLAARPRRRARGPGLTPMIDVVFLLLVFFMLASRFGREGVIEVAPAGPGAALSGPPRLVDIRPGGLALNGVTLDEAGLAAALGALGLGPEDVIVLRPRDGADLQRVVAVMEALGAAGFGRLALVD